MLHDSSKYLHRNPSSDANHFVMKTDSRQLVERWSHVQAAVFVTKDCRITLCEFSSHFRPVGRHR